jgi:hypothetical protein
MKTMNKLKYILGFCMVMTIQSCTDFVDPAIPYGGFETGVYLRTISSSPNVNFFALSTANFDLIVEAVDEENGNLVQEVDVFVSRRRGATVTPEAQLTTIDRSAFASTSESKYLRAEINVSISSALSAMGFTTADIEGGDFFEFRLSLLDTKGRIFTNTNLSADASGGVYYKSPFFYRVPVVCPSDLGGTYDYETTNIACANCPPSYPGVAGCLAEAPITGSGTLTDLGGGRYTVTDATFGQYGCAWDDNPAAGVTLIDACNIVSTGGSDQYGLVYTFVIVSNDGTDLTIDWSNDYGDSGTTVLTRTDGKTWPLDLTN